MSAVRGERVLVINPNSNETVTAAMDAAISSLGGNTGVEMETRSLTGAPLGIESEADAAMVAPMVAELVRAEESRYSAFVIGCFLDPGLAACRHVTDKPVFGIGECSVYAALSLADQFGVLALSAASVKRHKPIFRRLGVWDRLAGGLPLSISVAEAVSAEGVYPRIREAAVTLRESYGAGAVILGCAGMAKHRRRLQDDTGISIIDPVQAGAMRALGAVLTNRNAPA
jgi:allantoin racemase